MQHVLFSKSSKACAKEIIAGVIGMKHIGMCMVLYAYKSKLAKIKEQSDLTSKFALPCIGD